MCKDCFVVEPVSFGLFGAVKKKSCDCPCKEKDLSPHFRVLKCNACGHALSKKHLAKS